MDEVLNMQEVNEDICKCGKETTKGCHGIEDGSIYSEYYCDTCFHNRLKVEE
jgi:hypothetical protein